MVASSPQPNSQQNNNLSPQNPNLFKPPSTFNENGKERLFLVITYPLQRSQLPSCSIAMSEEEKEKKMEKERLLLLDLNAYPSESNQPPSCSVTMSEVKEKKKKKKEEDGKKILLPDLNNVYVDDQENINLGCLPSSSIAMSEEEEKKKKEKGKKILLSDLNSTGVCFDDRQNNNLDCLNKPPSPSATTASPDCDDDHKITGSSSSDTRTTICSGMGASSSIANPVYSMGKKLRFKILTKVTKRWLPGWFC